MKMKSSCMALDRLYCVRLTNYFVSTLDGIVPPHFYGVMAKTDLGCQVLQEKGHFVEFAAFIRRHGLESDDQEVILKLKSVLWAVVCLLILQVRYVKFTILCRGT